MIISKYYKPNLGLMSFFWSSDIFDTEDGNGRDSVHEIPSDLPVREHFSNSWEFLFVAIGTCVGLGNLITFPYWCTKFGGGTFIVAYIIASMTVGLPYFFLELAVGQYTQLGMFGIGQLCPLFKGIGWAMVFQSFYGTITFTIILARALLYFFKSIQWDLPWRDCGNEWNTVHCVPAICKESVCSNVSEHDAVSSVKEYFERRILQKTDRIDNLGNLQWELVGTLILVWIACYFSLWKGVSWTAAVMYFTVAIPYLLLSLVLIQLTFLPGAWDGIILYLTLEPSKFLNVELWKRSVNQVVYSLGLAYGTLLAHGSLNNYHNNLYWQFFVVAVIDFLTSFVSGLVIFAIIGFMSKEQGTPIKVHSGLEFPFIIFPTFVLEIPWSKFWAVVLFIDVLSLGLDSQFCNLHGVMVTIQDEYKFQWIQRTKIVYLVVCFAHFVFGLIYVTQGGDYALAFTEGSCSAEWIFLIILLTEGCTIAYVYGVNNFYIDLEDMLGFRPTIWWKICWLVISPITLGIVVILVIVDLFQEKGNDYPVWMKIIAWLLTSSSLLCIPIYMVYYIAKEKGDLWQRLNKSVKPTSEMSSSSSKRKQ